MKTEAEAVDISAFLPVEDTILDILAADGRPTGWKVTLGGPSHPKATAFAEAMSKRSLHKARMIEQAQVNGRKYQAEDRTADEVRRENAQWVISRIVDWTPIKIAGDVIAFSDKAAEDLLIRPDMAWAYVQIVEALNSEKLFTKR